MQQQILHKTQTIFLDKKAVEPSSKLFFYFKVKNEFENLWLNLKNKPATAGPINLNLCRCETTVELVQGGEAKKRKVWRIIVAEKVTFNDCMKTVRFWETCEGS